jgi:hypothetical protein
MKRVKALLVEAERQIDLNVIDGLWSNDEADKKTAVLRSIQSRGDRQSSAHAEAYFVKNIYQPYMKYRLESN